MISAGTECLSALLTIAFLTGFLYLWLIPRVRPNPNSGRLLCSLDYPRWQRLLGAIGAAFYLAVAIGVAVGATLGRPDMPDFGFAMRQDGRSLFWGAMRLSLSLAPFWFFLSVLAATVFSAVASLIGVVYGVDLREQGLVLCHGRVFIPWAKVRYCRWKSANRRLVIGFKREFLRFARPAVRVDVASDEFDRVARILLGHTEVRDRDGRPIPTPSAPGEPLTPIEEPPASRNRFQFDLKMVLLLFLTVASACGSLTIRWQRERPRKNALAQLASLQANVIDIRSHALSVDLSTCSRAPNDEDLAVLAALSSLNSLEIADAPITDAGLAHLRGLTGLGLLYLSGTQITDAGLAQLRDLRRLEFLNLSRTRLTGSGLKELSGSTHLKHLFLRDSSVTDAGLAGLAGFQKLTVLDLSGTRVTGAGLVHLAGLPSLESINLTGTGVTDAGLSHLARLPNLKYLGLDNTWITDAGLAQLNGLTGITEINLSNTGVTDSGIEHLQKLRGLRNVWLAGTRVTDAGRKRLKDALPNVIIR